MDGAERFELRLNIEREPKCAAEEQDADAELRDHYFVATLTEDAEDGEEANGYVSIWATDAEGTLLDGSTRRWMRANSCWRARRGRLKSGSAAGSRPNRRTPSRRARWDIG